MPPEDKRNAAQLLRQWDRLDSVKKQLVKAGLATGDATPAQILDAIRKAIPQELFAESQ